MIKKGDVIKVFVSGIEDYGIFIKYEEYTGLIHISEISNNFVKSIYDYVSLGEQIYAEVLEIDEDTKKIKLSIKNIEYRICNKIPENVEEGFKSLEEKLPEWISNAENEMKKMTNK